jgi:heme-degrading monooxygenase HmoA
MFIAMNRFQVIPDKAPAFEALWLSRDSHLAGVPGFVAFSMLRGPAADDHVLYSSHTTWQSREDFETWTRSDAFRAAHRGAGNHAPLYLGPPRFEGFEIIQTVTPSTGVAS